MKHKYLTLEEAAEELETTVSWIKDKVCSGEVDGELGGPRWLVSVESLQKLELASSLPKPDGAHTSSSTHASTRQSSKKVSTEKNKVSASTSNEIEPQPSRRQALEERIETLDRAIAQMGDRLREGMLGHARSGDAQGPGGYGKAAERLLRKWNDAREERTKLATILKNLDGISKQPDKKSSSSVGADKNDNEPAAGITGYYPGEIAAKRRRSSAEKMANLSGRDLLLRSQARESARKMQDRGSSRAARDAAADIWAKARREAERGQGETQSNPGPSRKPKTKRKANSKKKNTSKNSKKVPVPSAGKSSSPSPSKTCEPGPRMGKEVTRISHLIEAQGHPAPLGNPSSGIVVVVEQPVGPRILEALKLSLGVVGLTNAYVTYASTGLLNEELQAINPRAIIAVGDGGARDIDATDYTNTRQPFSEAEPGAWFPCKEKTSGLFLPSLAPALNDEAAKRRFWKAFLSLKSLTSPK